MTEENNFCVVCGAMLPPGAEFCPACGSGIDGKSNPHVTGTRAGYTNSQSGGINVGIFILVYGLIALIYGLYSAYLGLTYTEASYNDLLQMAESMGMGGMLPAWSDSIPTDFLISGILTIASGALALLSYWFCRQGGPRNYAVVACFAASVLSFWFFSVVSIIVGLIVTFLLYRDKNMFTS